MIANLLIFRVLGVAWFVHNLLRPIKEVSKSSLRLFSAHFTFVLPKSSTVIANLSPNLLWAYAVL